MLHVVSRDAVADLIVASGILKPLPDIARQFRDPDTVVSWLDALYDGPIDGSLSPINLAHRRCQYIAAKGWSPYLLMRQRFAARDAALARTARQDEAVFWFEYDLAGTLQLVQALDRLAGRRPENGRYSWILRDPTADGSDGKGFGDLSADEIEPALAQRVPIPNDAWAEGRRVWRALASGDPAELVAVAAQASDVIPPLKAALHRLLQEFPAQESGLSRSQRQILEMIDQEPAVPAEILDRASAREERPFLGEQQVWSMLDELATAERPLIEPVGGAAWISPVVDLMSPDDPDIEGFLKLPLRLTEAGRTVLAGDADWLARGARPRWIGGYEIDDPATAWRWDAAKGTIVPGANAQEELDASCTSSGSGRR